MLPRRDELKSTERNDIESASLSLAASDSVAAASWILSLESRDSYSSYMIAEPPADILSVSSRIAASSICLPDMKVF